MQHRSWSYRGVLARGNARRRELTVLLLAGLVLTCVSAWLLPAGPALADTTSGESTTGTASTVSPSTIAVGGALTYTLSGFPDGSTVQVLIDDGALAGDEGVLSEVRVQDDGTTTGTLELPAYATQGLHWLRFRVSAGPEVPTSSVRTTDYTNKSPYFTVAGVTVIGGAGSGVAAQGVPTTTTTQAPVLPAPARTIVPNEALHSGASDQGAQPDHFPLIGASFLALALLLVVLAAVIVRNRWRLAEYERGLTGHGPVDEAADTGEASEA